MVVGGRGGRLSPHPLGHRRLQTLSPSALSPLASRPGTQESTSPTVHPRLGRGWVWSGCPGPPLGQAGLVVQYATWCRKCPLCWPGRQAVGGACPPSPRRPPGRCRHLIGLHLRGSAAPGQGQQSQEEIVQDPPRRGAVSLLLLLPLGKEREEEGRKWSGPRAGRRAARGSTSELHPQTTLRSSCCYCQPGPNPSSSAHLGQCHHLEEGQQVSGAD